jgi:arylsulfatase A-like enzyme
MKQKNIIFLMTDQQRLDCTSFSGSNRVDTPNIDRIAESVGFTGCRTINPICTPARTGLLTGRYTHQIGTLSMSGDLHQDIPTYPQALQRAGYHTAGIGKFHFLQTWKWGAGRQRGVNLVEIEDEMKKYGFDYIWESSGKQLSRQNYCHYCKYLDELGLLDKYRDFVDSAGGNYGHLGNYDIDNTNGDPWPFEEKHHVEVITADEIIGQIVNRPEDKPFFIFGSFCSPHKPFDPPQRYLDMIPDEALDLISGDMEIPEDVRKKLQMMARSYLATIKLTDDQIGRVFEALESEGLLDDTVILFTTDHGEMGGDHCMKQKNIFYKESVRVPAAIRHPDYLEQRIVESPIEITDLTATILEIAGLDPVEALSIDWPAFNNRIPCRSLMPIVNGDTDRIRDFAFSECSGVWNMIVDEKYKYVRYLDYDEPGKYEELIFNLVEDPDELVNLAKAPEGQALIQKYRDRRDWIMDSTPSCQTRWAPLMGG